MYDLFHLPEDFLTRDYTDQEKEYFDSIISNHVGATEVTEELTPKQKAKADKWQPSLNVKIDHKRVFGDSDRIILDTEAIPRTINSDNWVNTSNHQHTFKVLSHLKKHGYAVDNYHEGLTYHTDNPKRKLRIGDVLKKTAGDTQEWIREGNDLKRFTYPEIYERDPERKNLKGKKSIVITKNVYDVAGMSTGRSWSSCMNMDDGCNRHYLKHDIYNGTLSAYLTSENDHGLKQPFGRVNLKRFTNANGHSIWRPEGRSYGTFRESSMKEVEDWAKTNYPAKSGIYIKSPDLYDDDGSSVKIENFDSGIHKIADQLVDHVHRAATEGPYNDKTEWLDHSDIAGNIFSAIPKEHRPELAVHVAINYAARDRHDDREDAHFAVKDAADVPRNLIRDHLKSLSPEKSFELHSKIHEDVAKIGDIESNEFDSIHRIHAKLIDNIMSPDNHNQAMKDTLISHITKPNHHADNYYDELFSNEATLFDKKGVVQHTSNPRVLHGFVNKDLRLPSGIDNDFSEEDYHHIGKHADEKLAWEVTGNHIDHTENHMEHFVKGLNENPIGEHIQHKLTDQFMFHDGNNKFQNELMHVAPPAHLANIAKRISDVGVPGLSDSEMPHAREYLKHVEKMNSVRQMHNVNYVDHEPVLNTFKQVASHTKFDSVKEKLRNRVDVASHSEFSDLK